MNIQKIFNRLEGSWVFNRTLLSKNADFPSGAVKGIAVFEPINKEILHYKEIGTFTTHHGEIFKIQKEYRYRLSKEKEKIEKYFIEPDDRDKIFYELQFCTVGDLNCFSAQGKHLCNRDHYNAHYEFLGGEAFETFKLRYEVSGPSKDYVSETLYFLNVVQQETRQA